MCQPHIKIHKHKHKHKQQANKRRKKEKKRIKPVIPCHRNIGISRGLTDIVDEKPLTIHSQFTPPLHSTSPSPSPLPPPPFQSMAQYAIRDWLRSVLYPAVCPITRFIHSFNNINFLRKSLTHNSLSTSTLTK